MKYEDNRKDMRDGKDAIALYNQFPLQAVIAPTAAISGNFAALEAIYYLTDGPMQTYGRIFHQNFIRYDHTYFIEPEFWEECPFCKKRMRNEKR